MKFTSIGYKLSRWDDKMLHYKMVKNDEEFLIISGGGLIIERKWTNDNKFESGSFTDDEYNGIIKKIAEVLEVDNLLIDGGEEVFFTLHEIKPIN